jgi:PST family polysaccharide transporter/teichuronic acid exporter/lipopolysaccharide exporter
MTVLAAVLYLPNWYLLVRPLCGATFSEYSQQLFVPIALAIVAGAVGYFAADRFAQDVTRLAVGGFFGSATYLSVSWYFNRSWFVAVAELVGRRVV